MLEPVGSNPALPPNSHVTLDEPVTSPLGAYSSYFKESTMEY